MSKEAITLGRRVLLMSQDVAIAQGRGTLGTLVPCSILPSPTGFCVPISRSFMVGWWRLLRRPLG